MPINLFGNEFQAITFDLGGTLTNVTLGIDPSFIKPRNNLRNDLEELRSREVLLGVISLSPEHVALKVLEIAGVADMFDPTYVLGKESFRQRQVTEVVKQKASGLLGKIGLTKRVEVPRVQLMEIDRKPSEEPIDYLLEAWSISKDGLLFVGDGDIDQLLAQRAGIAFRRIPEVMVEDIGLLAFLSSDR